MKAKTAPKLDPALKKIIEASHHDPFEVLGRHENGNEVLVRVFLPHAEQVTIAEGEIPMQRIEGTDFFEWRGLKKNLPERYRLIWHDDTNHEHVYYDPYCFPPQLGDLDLHLFGEGKHWHAYRLLGSHLHEVDGVAGVLFSVWAPNASRISVIGEFNRWDGRVYPMRMRTGGVWELFIPNLDAGALYKFEIRNERWGAVFQKADPYARHCELRPNTSSIIEAPSSYAWGDAEWLKQRAAQDWQHEPMSIYEVHLGSWQRGPEGEMLNYKDLAHRLVDYVQELGFSHIELLPVTEHPYDLSWGYQATGYYAPTSRFGTPDEFRYFVDYCHQNNISVIIDWVPAHFPKDAHGLARFDGTPLYEHEDPRLGEHRDWSTLIYNFGRYEVKNFLLSSALFWLEELHIDGLRVDAVASMLYLDYSREEGEWIPNKYGGNENLEAIDFLREMNEVVHDQVPGVLTMAEESTSWPQVTKPTYLGGLGFDLKWNMGWMNDTLAYIENEPIHRQYHHGELTFSMLYAFSENFLLPFSHDEVVHGKQSMLHKMPGDDWQRFANLRLIYTYMYAHPGKKLLFMGTEFGQGSEWNSAQPLDWWVLDFPNHQGMQHLVKDLNQLYHNTSALYTHDFDWNGFEWIDCNDAQQSVLSFLRKDDKGDMAIVILNLTPVPRDHYRIGVPQGGNWQEVMNSDSSHYGGSNMGNGPIKLVTEEREWMGRPWSLELTLPPLSGIIIQPMPEVTTDTTTENETEE
ncbi:MAG: 1,4-alpha-glucan branching protein GlgB [Pseudomonadota bacterium]